MEGYRYGGGWGGDAGTDVAREDVGEEVGGNGVETAFGDYLMRG